MRSRLNKFIIFNDMELVHMGLIELLDNCNVPDVL